MKGLLFQIQRFSTHDGPGIRTTVFFKGCNLRCAWCHNPESYLGEKQMRYQPGKCVECHRCERVCPKGVYVEKKRRINAEKCIRCGACVEECLYGALDLVGQEYGVEELVQILLRDKPYYDNSGGGVTLSGGEVLMQSSFAGELAKRLKEEGIHVAVDTAGNVPFSCLENVIPYTDLFLYDIKMMDRDLHKKYTGVSNDLILENAKKLLDLGVNMEIRVPVIQGINDTEENMRKMLAWIQGYGNVTGIRLLPYHDLGMDKAESMGIRMRRFTAPSGERMRMLETIVDLRDSKREGGQKDAEK